ncbi:unnamed protein product, partial [Ectocarpus sp. 4 AP-2014]
QTAPTRTFRTAIAIPVKTPRSAIGTGESECQLSVALRVGGDKRGTWCASRHTRPLFWRRHLVQIVTPVCCRLLAVACTETLEEGA